MPSTIEESLHLNDKQQLAVNKAVALPESSDNILVITGSAGSGKTFILNIILHEYNLNHVRYCCVAPTHKAALVMQQNTSVEAITLHSLLAMSPKLDILELDFNDLLFNSGDNKQIPRNGVVICDEASMINDELYQFLIDQCKEFNAKLILVCDSKQLQPVNQKSYSKVLDNSNIVELDKIFRQDQESALMPILDTLRINPIYKFNTSISDKGSVICTTDIKQFADTFIEEFKHAINQSDILRAKILCWTNARVEQYNKVVHKLIFKDDEEYHNKGFLTCRENTERNNCKLWNSMDYIICEEPEKIDMQLPDYCNLPGWRLTLYDSLLKFTFTVDILSNIIDAGYFKEIANRIETLRIEAIRTKDQKLRTLRWKDYYKLQNSFCSPVDLYINNRLIRKQTFTHGYAISTHRSQGSSYNTVFVDIKDIKRQRDAEELRQLEYVALSRTRNNAYIYQ